LQDELAETQIAEPGYAGTNNELELEHESSTYDLYEYWDDLEYGDDEFWTGEWRQTRHQSDTEVGQKRKRGMSSKAVEANGKKRKVSSELSVRGTAAEPPPGPVVFKSREGRSQHLQRVLPLLTNGRTFALIPDWRTRYAHNAGVLDVGEMPVEMQRAAQAAGGHLEILEHAKAHRPSLDEAEEDDWEEEEDVERGTMHSLNPEMVQSILKQKLGEAGLEGVDEGVFMTTLGKMLAGEDGADEAAGELANSLLGKATEGDASLSGWLSQQGVSLESAAEDATSVATIDMPESGDRTVKGHNSHVSPPDSAIGVPNPSKTSTATREIALHPSSPEQRHRQSHNKQFSMNRPSKKVTFTVPSPSESSGPPNGPAELESRLAPDPVPPTNSEPLASEPAAHGRATRSRSAKATATTSNAVKASSRPSRADRKTAESKPSAQEKKDAPPEPTRQTCKRKTTGEEDEPGRTKRVRNTRTSAKSEGK